MYVLDRNRLGGHSTIDEASPPTNPPLNPPNTTNNPDAVYVLPLHSGADRSTQPGPWGGPAYFNYGVQLVFYAGNGDIMRAFRIQNGNLIPYDETADTESFPALGTTPIVSSNGNSNGIVWAVNRANSDVALCAYDADNFGNEIINIPIGSWNAGGNRSFGAFIEPTVVNGKVYVAFSHKDGINVIGVCF